MEGESAERVVTVRRCRLGDIDRVNTLYVEELQQSSLVFERLASYGRSVRHEFKLLRQDSLVDANSVCIVAALEDEVVGYAAATIRSPGQSMEVARWADIGELVVESGLAGGESVRRALLAGICAELASLEVELVQITTASSSPSDQMCSEFDLRAVSRQWAGDVRGLLSKLKGGTQVDDG